MLQKQIVFIKKKEETPSRGWKNAEKWALILINFDLICA
jgi:hypothetical protein